MVTNKLVNVNVPIFGLMGLLFIALKLTGKISWSWWWVTAPIWGPSAFVIAIGLLVALIALLVAVAQR